MLTAEVKSKSYEVRSTIDYSKERCFQQSPSLSLVTNEFTKKVATETPDNGTLPGQTK